MPPAPSSPPFSTPHLFAIGDGATIRPAYDAELTSPRPQPEQPPDHRPDRIRERQHRHHRPLPAACASTTSSATTSRSQAELSNNALPDYEQTLANAERFTTPEPKKETTSASPPGCGKTFEIEKRIFAELARSLTTPSESGTLPALSLPSSTFSAAFAQVAAAKNRYVRLVSPPQRDNRSLRHPVISKSGLLGQTRLPPSSNDLSRETEETGTTPSSAGSFRNISGG